MIEIGILMSILVSICVAATPLTLAACGELVVERSGVLNLGVEGMMIMGAVSAFGISQLTGSAYIGALGGMLTGILFSFLFAFLTLTLVANQVATGLALTILGLGLSGMLGEGYVGQPGIKMTTISIPYLSDFPIVGVLLFSQDIFFYLSIFLLLGVYVFLYRTRLGLMVRSLGDNHDSAHTLGISVIFVRYLTVLFGGAMAGLAGAQLSLVQVPQWTEAMTAGKGWIALALVVFASWRPLRLLVGAYLFGAVTFAQFHVQALGYAIPAQFLSSLPYLATIIVLVLISSNRRLTLRNTPTCLGRAFVPAR